MKRSYLLFNKPYRVLCQFTPEAGKQTLADYIDVPDVYPAGRLDYDSEGLLILTDDGEMQNRITDPRFGHPRTYWVQVEGVVTLDALQELAGGVVISGKKTLPCIAVTMDAPGIAERDPPIRSRKSIPTSWLSLTLREGRNRQVRHMTAAVGYPTLRLIRSAIGSLTLDGMQPGSWRHLTPAEQANIRSGKWRASGASRPDRD